MDLQRDSFIFYRDWADTLKSYSPELKSELFDSIVDLALDGCESNTVSDIAKLIFEAFRPKILRDSQSYMRVCERNRANGKKGGRPKANETEKTQETDWVLENPNNPKNLDNDNDNDIIIEEVLHTSMSQNLSKTEDENINYLQILEFINASFEGKAIPSVRSLSDSRKRAIKARLKQHGKQVFCEVIKKAAESEFLNGNNNRNWIATLDWILNPTNFCKILDGNYSKPAYNGGFSSPTIEHRKILGENAIMQAAQKIDNIIN